MKLVAFNFTKISAEKLKEIDNTVKILPNIDIAEISDIKPTMLKTKDSLVGVKFSFIIDYSPDFAKIDIAGNLILALDSKKAKETLKAWKDKNILEDIRLPLLNLIMKKSTIKALSIEEDIGLPAHMPLASLRQKPAEEKK